MQFNIPRKVKVQNGELRWYYRIDVGRGTVGEGGGGVSKSER